MHDLVKIPLWIKIYSGWLILTAIAGTYSGLIDPYFFFGKYEAFGVDLQALPHKFLNGLWGTRNAAALCVLLIGLLFNRPEVVMAVFMHRFFTEFLDIFYLGTFVDPDGNAFVKYGIGMALFLVPEALGAWTLWKLTQARYRQNTEQ